MENLIEMGQNCYEKVLILSKANLFQVVIPEVHNQLPTEFSSALCYKKWLRTGNKDGLNRKMGIICFINLPNYIQWDQVKDNTKWLSKRSLFYSHQFLTSTIKPTFGH